MDWICLMLTHIKKIAKASQTVKGIYHIVFFLSNSSKGTAFRHQGQWFIADQIIHQDPVPLSFLLHPRSKFEYKWRAYGILLQLYYNRFQRFDLPMKPFHWVKKIKFTTRESRLSNSFVTRFFPRMNTKHAIPWLNQLWASSAVFEFDPNATKAKFTD